MAETEPVKTVFEIDDRQVKAKFDEFERRIKKAEEAGKRAGKGGSAFFSAAVGGAAGFVAGAVQNNPAVASITDVLLSVVAAILLPIFQALMPAIEALTKILIPIAEKLGVAISAISDALGPDLLASTAIGAYLGGRIGGPGGAAVGAGLGASVGAGMNLIELHRQLNVPLTDEERLQRTGGSPAPEGSRIFSHEGDTEGREVEYGEKVPVWIGPIRVGVDREQLWGPDVMV